MRHRATVCARFVRRTASPGALAAGLLLAGCTVGPDFHRPAATEPAARAPAYTVAPVGPIAAPDGQAQQFVTGGNVTETWWKAFGSARLDALVDRALAHSPTLAAAQAALKAAHEQTAAQRGFFFPTVSGNVTPSRQRISGNTSGNDPGLQGNGVVLAANPPASPVFTFYTAQVGISYVPDVFGANRRAVESLRAQEDVARFAREAATITLATNVVAAALQAGALASEIQAAKATIDAQAKALVIARAQQQHGLLMAADVAGYEAALASAEAALPPLIRQLEQTRDLLRVLVGATPDTDVDLDFTLDQFTLPRELPLSLPATLLDQRPDVRAAEAQLHAASAQVGQAIAARLPQLTITGAYGGNATSPGQLFAVGAPFWNIFTNLGATLFDGGTLAHRQHAAEAELEAAKAQYRATVLAAFQNVADTLHAIEGDADGYAAAVHAEAAAATTRTIAAEQYRAGLVTYQTLLAAEAGYQQAVVQRIQAQTNRFGDVAALYQALGGGWWNRAAKAG